MTGALETEIKLRAGNDVQQRLHEAGFRVSSPREFESNTLYDTQDFRLRQDEMLLRLRQNGERGFVTWKGPSQPGPHKSRPECETTVGSVNTLAEVLGHLGFKPVFRYEKFRTEYHAESAPGVVVYDETPIGDFLEIEGPAEWIDEVAAKLGYRKSDYILDSYGTLYRKLCAEAGIQPTHMVFPSKPRPSGPNQEG